jgi:hypothetical protein
MNNRKLCTIATIVMMTALLSLAGGLACAADRAPLTPENAAKKENFRKQQEQRITPEKRKAAAENLKAERLRVYQAKQAKQASEGKLPGTHPKPEKKDNK